MNYEQKKPEEMTNDEIALERFKTLPKSIQDAILHSGWQNIIRNLVNQYGLRVDQGTQLENMVFSMMLGSTDSDEFFKFIMDDLKLDEPKALELFKDIDFKIFTSIYKDVVDLGPDSLLQVDETKKEIETEDFPSFENSKETFMRDDIDSSSADDEILTVTRDEILRDIENPVNLNLKEDSLPDLMDSTIMPKNQESGVSNQKAVNSEQGTENDIEIREKEIPANLPSATETKVEENKPVNPVEAGLGSKVSTSSQNYQSNDPYREPIQ